MCLHVAVGRSQLELQDVHVHIKSKITCCRKEILDVAVVHSLIFCPGNIIGISHYRKCAVSLNLFISALIYIQPGFFAALVFKGNLNALRGEDITALGKALFLVGILDNHFAGQYINERLQTFTANAAVFSFTVTR